METVDKVKPGQLTPEQQAALERARARFRTPEAVVREQADREYFQAVKPGLGHPDLEPVPGESERLAVITEAIEALRTAREQQGLSIADVAERSGIERSAIYKLESGRQTNPTIGTLTRYASALGLTIHVSLTGSSTSA